MKKLDQYYNRYADSQNYDEVLYRADRVLQSAELNETQSIAAAKLQRLADSIFQEGDIVKDAKVSVDAESAEAKCEAGLVYVRGAVRLVPEATLQVPLEGTVSLGVHLKETIVTELEDPSLYNPAQGCRAEGEPGAARLKLELKWGLGSDEDEGYYALYTVKDGVVTSDRGAAPGLWRWGIGNDGDILSVKNGDIAWTPPNVSFWERGSWKKLNWNE